MASITPTPMDGLVAIGIQADEDTIATAFLGVGAMTFTHTPNPAEIEVAPEIGTQRIDGAPRERMGFDAVNFTFTGELRPENHGMFFRLAGMDTGGSSGAASPSGGFRIIVGFNDDFSITDDEGIGTVNIITHGSAVEGTRYSATELASLWEEAINDQKTQTYTVTYATNKFTIAHGGTTLSLHHTTFPMTSNMLGFDHSADDTAATSYDADEERLPVGRHQVRDGEFDVLRVTDTAGPEDVDVLDDVTLCVAKASECPWSLCALWAKALNDNVTLTKGYWVTFYGNKFTIETDDASTFSMQHDHANDTAHVDLGYDDLEKTGAASYEGATALRASKVMFSPIDTGAGFPQGTIVAYPESQNWNDLLFKAARVSEITLNGEDKSPITFDVSGSAVTWYQATGSETITPEDAAVAKPNTDDLLGHVKVDGVDYRIAGMSFTTGWEELIEPQLVHGQPYAITPNNRVTAMTAEVYMGADEGDLYREAFFGGSSGTTPDTAIVEKALDMYFVAGQSIAGITPAERYAIRFECDRAQFIAYAPDMDASDMLHGSLEINIVRDVSNDWTITLVNGIDDLEVYNTGS